MNIKIKNGELALPDDFSFEIEQNSAFFSDEGAGTLAFNLPATPENTAKLKYPTRIGRREKFVRREPAMIVSGAIQKKGTLIVDSASESGLSCSIALEDSVFYAKYKDKNLKELFGSTAINTFNNAEEIYAWLWKIYNEQIDSDFRIFPVAVNYDASKKTYQINNEPILDLDNPGIWGLKHATRIVDERGDLIGVPEGYGISPFLKLYRFLEIMFNLCGFYVRNNCFANHNILKNLVLVNNCSDVICNGKINYSDLVPNKTVSEILEWMRNKFNAQIVVNVAESKVDILLLEDILTNRKCDLDLTDLLIDDFHYVYSDSSRVTLSSDISLPGAATPTESVLDLIAKYKTGKALDESECITDGDLGLFMRKSTGQYYERFAYFGNKRDMKDREPVGSNYFKYDRKNSDKEENKAAADIMPVMVFSKGFLMPFIGERKHRNSTYNSSGKDEEQEIIIVDYAGASLPFTTVELKEPAGFTRIDAAGNYGGHYYYATTQKYDNRGKERPGRINLTPDEFYPLFWRQYNNILLNNNIRLEGKLKLSVADIMKWNMYSLKLFNGQYLLPVQLRFTVGARTECVSAEFVLIKNYDDAIEDKEFTLKTPEFKWVHNISKIEAKKKELSSLNPGKAILYEYDSSDDFISGKKNFFLPAPINLSEKSPMLQRKVKFYYVVGTPISHNVQKVSVGVFQIEEWFDSAKI